MSRIWRSIFPTAGSAFSNSSKRITESGRSTIGPSSPPSPWPTKPLGTPRRGQITASGAFELPWSTLQLMRIEAAARGVEESREEHGRLGLADARRPAEEEHAAGTVAVGPSAEPRDERAREVGDHRLLADDARVQVLADLRLGEPLPAATRGEPALVERALDRGRVDARERRAARRRRRRRPRRGTGAIGAARRARASPPSRVLHELGEDLARDLDRAVVVAHLGHAVGEDLPRRLRRRLGDADHVELLRPARVALDLPQVLRAEAADHRRRALDELREEPRAPRAVHAALAVGEEQVAEVVDEHDEPRRLRPWLQRRDAGGQA